ncbi:uncharacterized protein LOC134816505 isoform X2 [Bolinopsis microptera]|uniref:uncharacterized protein LOC134816505 isoform X2 n=1 Tax=Bolinopsis microptera TaxID=2820187 RepID=UPI00307AD5AF
MFLSRKALIGALVTLFCLSALIYKTEPYRDLLNNFQGGENIVIEISSDPDKTPANHETKVTEEKPPEHQLISSYTKLFDVVDDVREPTEPLYEKPTEPIDPANDIMQPTKRDLSISSPQPVATIEPRGHHAAAAAVVPDQESPKKIGDSWDHVKKTDDILEFVRSQCVKYEMITVVPGEEAKKPRMLVITKNWIENMILYSSNPKTGSTSFKKWFARLQGENKDYEKMSGVHAMKKYGNIDEAWISAESKSSDPDSVTLNDVIKPFYKVGFMRNPLLRLISGFRDKILRRAEDGIKPEMRIVDPSLTAESPDTQKFAAFTEGVMKGTIKNIHYTTQWSKMKICDFPYDIIAQTETTSQQIKEIQEHTNTTQFEFPGSRTDIGYDSVATVNLAHEFYDKVKPDIMEQIYQYYKWDFVLMGYTKFSNPNFPYLDFDQDFEKEFGPLDVGIPKRKTAPSRPPTPAEPRKPIKIDWGSRFNSN